MDMMLGLYEGVCESAYEVGFPNLSSEAIRNFAKNVFP